MILEATVKEYLRKACEAQKKVRTKDGDVSKVIDRIVDYLTFFNSIGEFDFYALEVGLDEIPIPNELKGFIWPKAVRYSVGDYRSKDLIYRSGNDDDVKKAQKNNGFNLTDWIIQITTFRGWFKKDASSDVSSLASLRTEVALTTVLDSGVYLKENGFIMMQTNDVIYPIHLDFDMSSIFTDDYLSRDVESVIQRYCVTIHLA